MTQNWTYTATIWSAALIKNESEPTVILIDNNKPPVIEFLPPQKVDNPTWSTWDNATPPTAWEYNIKFRFTAEDGNEAKQIAAQKLEDLTARLSFFASVPVQIVSYGGITNAPDKPVPGEKYTSINFGEAFGPAQEIVLDHAATQHLVNLLLLQPDREISERVNRSMRWLQQSRLARSPIDEFTYMVIALENIGHLLGEIPATYPKCAKCKKAIEECPHCGEDTARKLSTSITPIQNFAIEKLGWDKENWKTLWKLRNRIFHGSRDLTMSDQNQIAERLTDLEILILSSIRHILDIPLESPPRFIRPKIPFFGGELHIEWSPPTGENDNQNE